MSPPLELLIHAARAGGEQASLALPAAEMVVVKPGGDFATTADLAAQGAIVSVLKSGAPKVRIIAEEDEHSGPLPPTFFSVDPFDGTIIGNHGAKEWGILIGYIENGRPNMGVLYQPERQLLAKVEVGRGCTVMNLLSGAEERINFAAQKQKRLDDGIVVAFDVNYTTTVEHVERFLKPIIATGKILVVRGLCSAIGNTMELLSSTVDVYMNPSGGKIWDYAPGALAVTEAGGAAYSFHGKDFTPKEFQSNELHMSIMFAQNAALAADILGVLGK